MKYFVAGPADVCVCHRAVFLIIEMVHFKFVLLCFICSQGGKGKAPWECLGKRPAGIHILVVYTMSMHTR
jgi:hypothetical protein